MPTTLPGGLWYPERSTLRRAAFVGQPEIVTLAPGDAIGNAFTLGVRLGGVGIRVKLWDALRVDLLDPADTVLATRDWAAAWTAEHGGSTRTTQVLGVEWRADIDLDPATEYRVLVTATGTTALECYAFTLDAAYPGAGTLVQRIGGAWTADPTRRCEITLRVTGC